MMMRARGLLVIQALLLAFAISCENGSGPSGDSGLQFTLSGQDTQAISAGEVGKFYIAVKNKGSSVAIVSCVRKANNLPDSTWSSSLCIGTKCFPPMIDSVVAEIEGGSTDTCLVDVQTGASGTALVTVELFDQADPAQQYEHTFSCTVTQ